MVKTLILVSLCLWGISGAAQIRLANQDELDEVRAHFRLDSIPKTRPQVANIEAGYWQAPTPQDSELRTTITFRPYLVEDQLCLTEFFTASASPDDSDWEWGRRTTNYLFWKPIDDECAEMDLRSLPPGTVWIEEPIPGAQVVQIFNGQDDLLIAGFDFVFGADFEKSGEARSYIDGMRSLYQKYRDKYSMRLLRLSLSTDPVIDIGHTFSATFYDANQSDAPILFFSLTPNGFVVRGVSLEIFD
jgi:hypothetical protein